MDGLNAESGRDERFHLSFDDLHAEARGGEIINLLRDGYHAYAAWEAAGALMERVRDLTDPGHPGSADRLRGLRAVDVLFGTGQGREYPQFAFNRFRSENEINEHRGVTEMLTGVVRALRHPFSHNFRPEMTRTAALEWLAAISALHRRLDGAVDLRTDRRPAGGDAGTGA